MAKAMSADEKRHVSRVVAQGCIVCRNLGYGETPAEAHHVRYLGSMGKRAPHKAVMALCPAHHRTGGRGVAYHAGPALFESLYGTERELLQQTYDEMRLPFPTEFQ